MHEQYDIIYTYFTYWTNINTYITMIAVYLSYFVHLYKMQFQRERKPQIEHKLRWIYGRYISSFFLLRLAAVFANFSQFQESFSSSNMLYSFYKNVIFRNKSGAVIR